jgi:hypothetical protein
MTGRSLMTRAEILTSIESVDVRQRQYRAMVHASHSTGTLTPEIRARARLTFGVLRVKRIRLTDWLTNADSPIIEVPRVEQRSSH